MYSCSRPADAIAKATGVASEWTAWVYNSAEPIPYADVNTLISRKNALQAGYLGYTKIGNQLTGPGNVKMVRILAVPTGRALPIWFDENGYLHEYYYQYIIVP